jgi:hypothetical protein
MMMMKIEVVTPLQDVSQHDRIASRDRAACDGARSRSDDYRRDVTMVLPPSHTIEQ